MKKKRFLSILLSIMLILSMLPVSVLAEGTETADETPACICETLCTENQVNADCPVCGAEEADLTQCLGTSEDETEPVSSTASANSIPVCICETACTEGNINSDCPVCGAEGADLSQCLGKQTEPEMGEETADPTPEPTPEIMQEPTQEPTNELDASVVEVQGMIDALPDAESLTGLSLEDQQAVYTKVQAAFDAYNALTDEQKAQITGAEIFDELFAVFNSMISAIPDEGEGVTLTGDGSSGNPYQIAEAADLKAFANKVNNGRETGAWAVLTADIVLNEGDLSGYNGTDTVSWEQWTPIGTNARRYTGTFDGNGHTVSGIYINNSSASYQGLFGCVGSGGTVQKVGVVNSYIQGGSYTGGVAGEVDGSSITNSYNTGTVNGGSYTGGVAGEVYNNGTVTNCYNTGTVSGGDYTGGVAGEVYNSTVTNSYNTGTVSGSSYTGGAAGYVVSSSTVTNSYSTGTVSGSRFYTGGVAGYVYNNSTVTNSYNTGTVNGNNINGGVAGYVDSGTVTNCYYLADTASAGIGSSSGTATPLTAEQMSGSAAKDNMTGFDFDTIWATRNESYTGQSTGSDENTVTVTTTSYAPYLQVFGEDSAPILSSTPSEVEKMQQETGDDNKTYYLIYDKEDLELFRDIVNGTLTGVNAQIYEADSGANGRLMADIVLNEDFDQSKFALDEDGNLTYDGSAEIPAFEQWTPIGDGNYDYTGAFDGNNHTVSGIYINDSSAGYQGLFGYVGDGSAIQKVGVVNSYISANKGVGGVAGGIGSATISQCYNAGTIIGYDHVGGVVGQKNGGELQNCYNTGSITGSDRAGGMVGINYGTLTNCYNTGTVTANGSIANGGGVVGENHGTIQNSYNIGEVIGQVDHVFIGGVTGSNSSIINNSYNAGTVSDLGGSGFVGGVAGRNTGTVQNCYNTGTIAGDESLEISGVVGWNISTVTCCYFLEGTASSGIGSGSGEATSLTVAQMSGSTAKDNMTGFDFDTIWAAKDESYTVQSAGSDENTVTVTTTSYAPYLQVFGENSAPILTSTTSEPIEKLEQETDEDGTTYYLIHNKAELELFRDIVNGTLTGVNAQLYTPDPSTNGRLEADIVLNPGFTFASDGSYTGPEREQPEQWTPIGNNSYRYTGTFDGNSHTVSGIYINDEEADYQGLFGCVRGTVQDLGVVNSYISGGDFVGGVAGEADRGAALANCYNAGAVSGDNCIGGVAGFVTDDNTIVTSCYNTGAVSGSSILVGGVAGQVLKGVSITSCYNTGAVSGDNYIGGVAGWNTGTVESCYNTGTVSGGDSARKGGIVGGNYNGVTNCYFLEGTASAGIGEGSGQATPLTIAQIESTGTDGLLARLVSGVPAGEENPWKDQLSAMGTWKYGKPAVQPVFVWQTVIENAPTFSVTIPETATVNGDMETVSANAGALRADQAIVVSVAADNEFKLENGKSSTVGYQLFVGDSTTAVNAGGTILSTGNTSQNGESASVKIRFALSENAPYAGDYSGTCKFVVGVE